MINIRRAKLQDRDAIIAVHMAAVRAVDSHYTPEEIESWAIPKDPATYDEAIRTKEFYVAEQSERIVGFAVLDKSKSEIEAIYVDPKAKGLGLGLKLIRTLEERAEAVGLQKLTLNASLNAVEFYKRAGFAALAESKYRLQSGLEIRCVPMVKEMS